MGIPDLRYQVFRRDAQLLWQLGGELWLSNSQMARKTIIDTMVPPVEKVYLKITELSHIDSAGLGVLMNLHIEGRKRQIQLVLLSPSPKQMKMLKSFRMDSVVPIGGGIEAEQTRLQLVHPEFEITPTIAITNGDGV